MAHNLNVLGSKIRALREAQGMARAELATACDMSESAIERIENGTTRRPRGSNLNKIAEVLSVPRETLQDASECAASDQAGLGNRPDDPKLRKVAAPALLIFLKTSDDGNVYGFECIEVLYFNYDGEGSALVRMDGEIDSLHPNDLDYILHGDEDGVRWYQPIWQSPNCPEFAPVR